MIKFSPDGRVLMTLGKAGVAGNPPDALTEPNDVITAPNGDILVAEGHSGQNANAPPDTVARISRFTKDGKVLYFIPDPEKMPTGTSAAEGVAVDAAGNIYGAEVGPKAVKRYVRK